jgi:hypothetical protein
MASGTPPRRGRSSHEGEPPPGATDEGKPASGSPTEASGKAHVLGDVASRRLAKAAAAAGAAASGSTAAAGVAASQAESAAEAAADSAMAAGVAVAADDAVAAGASVPAAKGVSAKPRRITRKAMGPPGGSVEPNLGPAAAAAAVAAAASAPFAPVAEAAGSAAAGAVVARTAPTTAVGAAGVAPRARRTTGKALGAAAGAGSDVELSSAAPALAPLVAADHATAVGGIESPAAGNPNSRALPSADTGETPATERISARAKARGSSPAWALLTRATRTLAVEGARRWRGSSSRPST